MRRSLLLAATATGAYATSLTYLGNFSSPNAGFLMVTPLGTAGPSLIISAFTGDPFAPDALDAVYDIGAAVASASIAHVNVTALTANITWPNEVTPVNTSAGWRGAGGLLVAGGFLVPPKTVGAVTAITLGADGRPAGGLATLSVPSGNAILGGFFYHRALTLDVDGDGLLDVLAARAIKPLFGATNGQLVWMKQPNVADPLAPAALPWAEAVLTNGSWSPDVLFALGNIRADADEQVYFTSFFTGGGLGMVLCTGCSAGGTGATWSQAAALQTVVLDASIGPAFDVQIIDLNGDGRLDLLVTNHVDNATDGGTPASGVWAYEAPVAPAPLTNASAWTRHTLAAGFAVREFGPNQAAPGAFKAFWPCGGGASGAAGSGKPSVVLAGDGDQRAYILAPADATDPTSWAYTLTELFDCKGTVGQPAVYDTDGDGCVEVFVPCYDTSVVHGWSFGA